MCIEPIKLEQAVWRAKDMKTYPAGTIAPSRLDAIRRKYAISTTDVPVLGTNTMCEHATGLRDPDHNFHMGVHKSMHNFLFFKKMDVTQRAQFIARVKSFP